MNELRFPWLEFLVALPAFGAIYVSFLKDPFRARGVTAMIAGVTLLLAFGAWQDFSFLGVKQADDRWHLMTRLVGFEWLTIDQLSAPLLPLVALLYFLTTITTLKTKIKRFSFASMLASEAMALALFSSQEPWLVIILLIAETIPPYLEMRARKQNPRVYLLHMGVFAILLLVGWVFMEIEGRKHTHSLLAMLPLLIAVLIRSGVAPFHCWMIDLFEKVTFGTALLFITRVAGAYAALRLLLPVAPDWVLRSIGLISLFTAVYASGMSLVQTEARRFYCYLFLSHSALVMVGLDMVSPIGLTGALCVWLSVGLSLGGFGLALRALEARRGRVNLTDFQGLYEHMPTLAVCFFLTGLGCVGFPGTVGFIGAEMVVDGAVEVYPWIGAAVVIAAALNGIAILQAYFKIFTGARHFSTVPLRVGPRERIAMLLLVGLIIIGGLVPQPGVHSRHQAAEELLQHRASVLAEDPRHSDEVPEHNAAGHESAEHESAEH